MEKRCSRGIPRIPRAWAALAIALMVIPALAGAHPPSDLMASLDAPTGTLTVTITHPVSNPANHYVKRVTVTRGGVTVLDQAYTGQPVATPFTYTYQLPAAPAGDLVVTADCSIAGSLTLVMEAPAPVPTVTGTATMPAETTPTVAGTTPQATATAPATAGTTPAAPATATPPVPATTEAGSPAAPAAGLALAVALLLAGRRG